VACEIPVDEGRPSAIQWAVLKNARNIPGARKFVEHLGSPAVAQVFQSFGFVALK
jgi:ABC-type molybdate transport system substrate-binding protein